MAGRRSSSLSSLIALIAVAAPLLALLSVQFDQGQHLFAVPTTGQHGVEMRQFTSSSAAPLASRQHALETSGRPARGGAAAAEGAITPDSGVAERAIWRLRQLGSIYFFVFAEKCLRPLANVQPLPPALFGMGALFVFFVALQKASPDSAKSVFKVLEPGYRMLAKWGTCFFIPALMALPVELIENAHLFSSPLVIIKFFLSIVICFMLSLFSTGQFALFFGKLFGSEAVTNPQGKAPWEAADTPAPAAEAESEAEAEAKPVKKINPYDPNYLKVHGAIMGAALACKLAGKGSAGLCEGAYMVCAVLSGYIIGNNLPGDIPQKVNPVFSAIATAYTSALVWGTLNGKTFLDVLRTFASKGGGGGGFLFPLLPPLILCLGLSLYEKRDVLFKDFPVLISTCMVTSLFALFSTATIFGAVMSLPAALTLSSVPKSVTAALALAIIKMFGPPAMPAFAIAMVEIFGLTTAAVAAGLFQTFGWRSPVMRGMATGATGSGLGTMSLASSDPEGFTYSTVTFALCGALSTAFVAIPPIRTLLLKVALCRVGGA